MSLSLTLREEQQRKMLGGVSVEENLSRGEMGDLEGNNDSCSWTVDCLRRRLFAERATSRVAKEDAEIMGRKLIELEKQLKLEARARNKAETMLKIARKKLKSLEISTMDQSSSAATTEGSGSSSTASPFLQEQEEKRSPQKQTKERNAEDKIEVVSSSSFSKEPRCPNSASTVSDSFNQVACNEQNSCSGDAANSHSNGNGSEEDENEFKSSLSSKESTTDVIRRSSEGGELTEQIQDLMDSADNTLAIVPVSICTEPGDNVSQTSNINEVLLALRHAKECLSSSMGIGGSIKLQNFDAKMLEFANC